MILRVDFQLINAIISIVCLFSQSIIDIQKTQNINNNCRFLNPHAAFLTILGKLKCYRVIIRYLRTSLEIKKYLLIIKKKEHLLDVKMYRY